MTNSIKKLLQQYEEYNLSEIIDYDKFNRFAIVHHSSSIEGSTLSEVETRLLLDENLTPKGKPLDHSLMTRDHYRALQFVIQEAQNKREITPEFIQQINAQVMNGTGTIRNTVFGTLDASKGEFRKENVSAGGTYFPDYSKVERLVQELCGKINEALARNNQRENRLDLSFLAHFKLVSIHPFCDGNGRTSRLLMSYIQQVSNLPLAIVFKEDKSDYYTALKETRKQNEFRYFQEFMRSQYEKFLKQEIKKYQEMKKGKEDNFSVRSI